MNPAVANDGAFAYSHTPPRPSFVGRRPSASPYLEARDRDEHTYAYTATPGTYRAAWEWNLLGRRASGRRLGLGAGLAIGLVVVVLVLTGAWRGAAAAGLRLSRYQLSAGSGVMAAGLTAAAAAPPAAAAVTPPPPAPRPAVRAADPTRPAQARHTADFVVASPPSVSAALIDRVLDSYQSPAAGSGALFYDLGVKYGIDPAYALAFYIHESAAGTKGVARFTHGIGNIRTTPGYADYEGYRSYATYAAGIEDWYKLIKELYVDGWGLRTPDAILARYAPWGDNNNPTIYASTVKQLVDSWQGQ